MRRQHWLAAIALLALLVPLAQPALAGSDGPVNPGGKGGGGPRQTGLSADSSVHSGRGTTYLMDSPIPPGRGPRSPKISTNGLMDSPIPPGRSPKPKTIDNTLSVFERLLLFARGF